MRIIMCKTSFGVQYLWYELRNTIYAIVTVERPEWPPLLTIYLPFPFQRRADKLNNVVIVAKALCFCDLTPSVAV